MFKNNTMLDVVTTVIAGIDTAVVPVILGTAPADTSTAANASKLIYSRRAFAWMLTSVAPSSFLTSLLNNLPSDNAYTYLAWKAITNHFDRQTAACRSADQREYTGIMQR